MQVRSSFILFRHVEHNGENRILNGYHMIEINQLKFCYYAK
jgi:hypothetical protein